MMKHVSGLINIACIFVFSNTFANRDSLQLQLNPQVEMGYSAMLSSPNSIFDLHSSVTGITQFHGGLGLSGSSPKKWQFSGVLSYNVLFIRQRLFFDGLIGFNNDIRLSHTLHDIGVDLSACRYVITEPKSSLGILTGLKPWYYLFASESNTESISDGTSFFKSSLTAYPGNRMNWTIYTGFRYLFKKPKVSLGFNIIAELRSSRIIEYTYSVENWFQYFGNYSAGGIFLRFGTFITF